MVVLTSFVAEQFLDGSDVVPLLEQMGSKGMVHAAPSCHHAALAREMLVRTALSGPSRQGFGMGSTTGAPSPGPSSTIEYYPQRALRIKGLLRDSHIGLTSFYGGCHRSMGLLSATASSPGRKRVIVQHFILESGHGGRRREG